MSEITYEEVGQDVLDLTKDIIREHHSDLIEAKIAMIFRSKAASTGKKLVWGKASKIPKRLQALLDYDFLIELAADIYEDLSDEQKLALIDHELCHCHMDDFGKAKMVHHDIEEFDCIIERYGAWAPDIKKTISRMKSLPLFPDMEIQVTRGAVDAVPAEVIQKANL